MYSIITNFQQWHRIMLPVQNGGSGGYSEERVGQNKTEIQQGKPQVLQLCLWCMRLQSLRSFLTLDLQFLLMPVPLSVSSSPWQMPHVSDISNNLGACVISIPIILRKSHINSYSGSNSLHAHSQWRSALLSHNPHQHLL